MAQREQFILYEKKEKLQSVSLLCLLLNSVFPPSFADIFSCKAAYIHMLIYMYMRGYVQTYNVTKHYESPQL